MKQYFIDKLKDIKSKIENTEKSIISSVSGTNNGTVLEGLVSLSKRLLDYKKIREDLTKDAVKYCTVAEVIEIASLTNFIGDETLNVFDKNSLKSAYKYNSTPITIEERDALVERFGYSFKEAKV